MIPLTLDITCETYTGRNSKVIIWSVSLLLLLTAITFFPISSSVSPLEGENLEPQVDAGDDILDLLMNEVATLNGTASIDEDLFNCTWNWESTTHPNITFLPDNSSTPSFTITDEGTITIRLTITDPFGLGSTDEVDVIVTENQPPKIIIASPPPSGSEGPFYVISDPVEFSANGTNDPEDRELTYRWTSNRTAVTLSSEKYFSIGLDDLGRHTITLNVSDPNGGSSQENVSILVREDPDPPVANIYLKPSRADLRYGKSEIITFDGSGTTDSNTFDTLQSMNFTWATNISSGKVIGWGPVIEVD
jgi:hypothetical protein